MNVVMSDKWKGSALEEFHHCPKCGSPEFGQQQDNSLKCFDCQFLYYVNPPVSVVAWIKNDQGQLLLTERKHNPAKGLLDFPGGFVEMQETLEEAIGREIYEELNLTIDTPQYVGSIVTTYPLHGLVYYPVDVIFRCDIADWTSLQVRDDVQSIRFFLPEMIEVDALAFESNRIALQRFRSWL